MTRGAGRPTVDKGRMMRGLVCGGVLAALLMLVPPAEAQDAGGIGPDLYAAGGIGWGGCLSGNACSTERSVPSTAGERELIIEIDGCGIWYPAEGVCGVLNVYLQIRPTSQSQYTTGSRHCHLNIAIVDGSIMDSDHNLMCRFLIQPGQTYRLVALSSHLAGAGGVQMGKIARWSECERKVDPTTLRVYCEPITY